jgi:hypothetical protein
MNTVLVVVLHERVEFSLKVLSIPKEGVVKVFTTNLSDQSLNEGMRTRCIRDGVVVQRKFAPMLAGAAQILQDAHLTDIGAQRKQSTPTDAADAETIWLRRACPRRIPNSCSNWRLKKSVAV